MENSQKVDATLNLSLDITQEERQQSSQLSVGYDEVEKTWRVIVKYTGNLQEVEQAIPESQAISLFNQYGIIRLPESQIDYLAGMPQIQFVEKPKQLYFSLDVGRSVSCINSVQGGETVLPGNSQNLGLTGKGVLVGIADSGIDFTHPAFRNADGSTRILFLWDQTGMAVEGTDYQSPPGYSGGVEWTMAQLDQLLSGDLTRQELPVGVTPPEETGSAHGTAVAGIAAGNGGGSPGKRYRGIAIESPLILVKLGPGKEGFPRTTEVMEALDYIVKKAIALQMPVSVNLSFGNNYGAHNGQSLFESYITDLTGVWKNVISIASGNEGDSRHHVQRRLESRMEEIPFAVAANEANLGLQIWKNYVDDFAVFIEAPDGTRQQIDARLGNSEQYRIAGTRVLVYYGEPAPYTVTQEIYLEWIPDRGRQFLTEGIWRLLLIPENIVDGRVELWLPTVEAVGMSTGFLNPSTETTLTIPSTARKIITVGAYRQSNDAVAVFSGRGDTVDGRSMPTLVAPGVDVVTASPGGRYAARTGTSMAAPFVTGSAALMMEWGIVRGNDPYLYGEKVKAYLIKGARKLPGQNRIPDITAGWGALCLRDSLPE